MRIAEIMRKVARDENLTLAELEVYMLSPKGVIDTARDPDPETPGGDMIPLLLEQPFKKYMDWFLENQLSGSCGATSHWLDMVTSRAYDANKGTLTESRSSSFLDKFLFTMISNGKRWYCRCTLKVHSFFLECIERKVCVYQSYFGKYPLARSIEQQREMDRMELMPLLEAAVNNDMLLTCLKLGTDMDWEPLSETQAKSMEKKYRSGMAITKGKTFNEMEELVYKSRKDIFLGAAPVHDVSTLEYRINTNPAPVDDIVRSVRRSARRYTSDWDKVLGSGKTLQELIDETA